jgi:hypothetical protein
LEVEGEGRINLAMTSLGLTPEASTLVCKKKHFLKQCPKEEVPTAAGLQSASQVQEAKQRCVFLTKRILAMSVFLHRDGVFGQAETVEEKGLLFLMSQGRACGAAMQSKITVFGLRKRACDCDV